MNILINTLNLSYNIFKLYMGTYYNSFDFDSTIHCQYVRFIHKLTSRWRYKRSLTFRKRCRSFHYTLHRGPRI